VGYTCIIVIAQVHGQRFMAFSKQTLSRGYTLRLGLFTAINACRCAKMEAVPGCIEALYVELPLRTELGKLMNTYHIYTARISSILNGSSALEHF